MSKVPAIIKELKHDTGMSKAKIKKILTQVFNSTDKFIQGGNNILFRGYFKIVSAKRHRKKSKFTDEHLINLKSKIK